MVFAGTKKCGMGNKNLTTLLLFPFCMWVIFQLTMNFS